ncbi:MAG: hypothetical protein Q9220_006240 [cf. Caloplaca sp. 1 TL-2023]
MDEDEIPKPQYGCTDMAFSCIRWPFLENAERKIDAEDDRWENSYPIWVPCCVMLPFGWLFRGRAWPSLKKSSRQRRWEWQEKINTCPAREQTKYPETRTSPCTLKLRGQDVNISALDLHQMNGLKASGLLRLPMEIRQEIYGYILGREENLLIPFPFRMRAVPTTPNENRIVIPFPDGDKYYPVRVYPSIWSRRPAILRTCRQVYVEAVDLLYTGNTFVVQYPPWFIFFAKCIPPQRLHAIRSLRISFGLPTHDIPCRITPALQWQEFWKLIASMQSLCSLDVCIQSWTTYGDWREDERAKLLYPLLQLRGLHSFDLKFDIVQWSSHNGSEPELVPLTQKMNALVRQIKEVAKMPRENSRISAHEESGLAEEAKISAG